MIPWLSYLLSLGLLFQSCYAASQICGQTQSSLSSGYLSSPTTTGIGGFGQIVSSTYRYPTNTDCLYEINAPNGQGVKLTWEKFDINGNMPDCSTDYVEVLIGCGRKSIGRLCSSNAVGQLPFKIYSPDNCLKIRFHSGSNNVTGYGFRARFITFDQNAQLLPYHCSSSSYGYSLIGNSGIANSPYWPRGHSSSSSCYFKLHIGSSYHAKIAFMDFNLRRTSSCSSTKMKIQAGGSSYSKAYRTVMSSTCGTKSPFSLTTKEDVIYIRYKAGTSYGSVYRGFVAGYMLYRPVSGSGSSGSSSGILADVIIPVIVVVLIGVVIFCVYRWCRARRANQGGVYQQAPVALTQSAPVTQPPPPAQGYAPPPPYGQPAGQPYPQPYPQGAQPPPGSYPEKQGAYPPPQGYYPPAGSQPYPASDGQSYPPPGAQPYPPPPPGGQPYPAPDGQSYPPPGAQPYPTPPPGGQPYPTAPPGGQSYPPPPPGGQPYPTQGPPPYPT